MQRRQFIAAASSVAAVGLAGCSGGGDNEEGDDGTSSDDDSTSSDDDSTSSDDGGDSSTMESDVDTSSPDAALESFLTGVTSEESHNAVVHSESPLEWQDPGDSEGGEEEGPEVEEQTFEVVEEGLSEEDLSEYRITEVSDDAISSIAEGDVAIVEYQISFAEQDDPRPVNYLVATEDGEWKVVQLAIKV